MITEFVLIVNFLGPFGSQEKPVGTFKNCTIASEYYDAIYRDRKEYNGFRCLRKDLVSKETLETFIIQKGN